MAPRRSTRKGSLQDDGNSCDQNPKNLLEDLNYVETVRSFEEGFNPTEQPESHTQRLEELQLNSGENRPPSRNFLNSVYTKYVDIVKSLVEDFEENNKE